MWDKVRNADEIVFVCTGNIIRSAFCDVYSHHLGIPKSIKSLGTTYFHDEMYPKTRKYLKDIGVDEYIISKFQPTHISEHTPVDNSVYFVMTRDHKKSLLENGFPESQIFFLRELDGYQDDILDPYYHGKFEQTMGDLKHLVERLKTFL